MLWNFSFKASILKVTKIHKVTIPFCQLQQVLHTEKNLRLTEEIPPLEQLHTQMHDKKRSYGEGTLHLKK